MPHDEQINGLMKKSQFLFFGVYGLRELLYMCIPFTSYFITPINLCVCAKIPYKAQFKIYLFRKQKL